MEREHDPTEDTGVGASREGERASDEGSRGPAITPDDAVPDKAAPPGSTGPPSPDPDRVVEEKGRTDRTE